VTITERNLTAGRAAVAAIVASTGRANVHVAPLELADRSSIDRLVAAGDGPLDILINNARVMQIPRLTLTPKRHELSGALTL
jgi:NAD(P)-dependent dehydrogenase (short-subunit alcohol dehydrogenase family)